MCVLHRKDIEYRDYFVQNKRHILWTDVSKGIVITLMVIGHTSIPGWLSNWIWSFHMPFFFIISALFTSWDKGTIYSFIIRKVKLLLIPFVVCSIINWGILAPILGFTYPDYAVHILRTGWGGIALWFIPVFFISLTICRCINIKYAYLVSAILLFVSLILSHSNFNLPWAMSVTPFATSLMVFIRKFQREIKHFLSCPNTKMLTIAALGGAIPSLIVSQYFRLDMCSNHIIPIIPILIGIVGGCSTVITSSILLANHFARVSKFIGSIGRNTYEIMALSQVIIMSINYYYPLPAIAKYMLMIVALIAVVKLRHIIEGKFAKQEVI